MVMSYSMALGLTIICIVVIAILIIWISPYMRVNEYMKRHQTRKLGVVIVDDVQPEPRSYTNVLDIFKTMSRLGFTYASGSFTTLHFFNYNTEIWRSYEVQEQTNGTVNRIWTLTREEHGGREEIPVCPNPPENNQL